MQDDHRLASQPRSSDITDPQPEIAGDPLCKIVSYNQAHEDAVELGYPSITEALEATPFAGSAESDEPEVNYEVWDGDDLVAASTSEAEGRHYYAVYSQDGPVRLVKATTYRAALKETPNVE